MREPVGAYDLGIEKDAASNPCSVLFPMESVYSYFDEVGLCHVNLTPLVGRPVM